MNISYVPLLLPPLPPPLLHHLPLQSDLLSRLRPFAFGLLSLFLHDVSTLLMTTARKNVPR